MANPKLAATLTHSFSETDPVLDVYPEGQLEQVFARVLRNVLGGHVQASMDRALVVAVVAPRGHGTQPEPSLLT